MMYRKLQRGVTLVETMIAMLIGLVVIGGAITIYVSTVSSSTATLKSSKLNQELGTLMNVMTNDIRRAGFWGNAAANLTTPQDNPFSALNDTTLEVMDTMTNDAQIAANNAAGGECIVYTYDRDNNGNVDDPDITGFRLNNGVVQMRQQGDIANNPNDHDHCNNANDTWLDVTDGNLIDVNTLNFSLGSSECLNTAEPNGVDDDANGTIDNSEEADCYAQVPAAASGDITVETRQVTVSVTGALINDANTILTLTEDVRVRNDFVRVR